MNRVQLDAWMKERFAAGSGNVLTAAIADGHPELAGTVFFDRPLIGIAAADDPLFEKFKSAEVVGPWHLSPRDWLPEARSVLSFFFPFSERVRASNRIAPERTSLEWLYGRIEGQEFLSSLLDELCAWLQAQGVRAVAPSRDSRFRVARGGQGTLAGFPGVSADTYASNWSERHVAFAAGLGTFGLSKGLITEKGMAGRLGSVVVDAQIEPTSREYDAVYERCIQCGACVRRCPAHAISLRQGKKHPLCAAYLATQKRKYAPRYGCGKCQTAVPCEFRSPCGERTIAQ
ncbi:4Fe-4S binding protein [Pyramidobacter sp. C12-8]|uniref:4Fe-4S binding protein n=1 Tax=Pyramidobacter sp. C12-8 TaxID=1943580 RepID=UPI00098F4CE7|nr:4Fe-4S binding protein [Pyramidobacter sp. C12-8]OON88526.1 hypothetical protein B0D78_08400 [Pyramidobacter sp. C12-8]